MKKILTLFSGALVAAGFLMMPLTAQAQELTLRLEPGMAVPMTSPQTERFDLGVALAVKPTLSLGRYLDVGPSLSLVTLDSKVPGVDDGTIMAPGAFTRLKLADKKTTDLLPWVDGDLQYVRTQPLDRFGWALAAGVSAPTSDARNIWVGPFVRYQGVFQDEKSGFNTDDARIGIIGISVEIGPKVAKAQPPVAPPVETPCPPCPQPPVVEQPKPRVVVISQEEKQVEIKQVIQFAWDSPVLDSTANKQLADVVRLITSSKGFEKIQVEGHASSEGQVKHNNVLALKRAQSVANFLVANGVAKDKLTVKGFGSSVPVATNSTEAGRVMNRRAEFVVKFTIIVTKVTKESK